MTTLDIKIALENYREFEKKIEEVSGIIEYIEDKQMRVSGGSPAHIPEGNRSKEFYKLGLIEKKAIYLKDLDHYWFYIELADHFIRSLEDPYNQLIKDKYLNNKPGSELEIDYGYSGRQILNIINSLIDKYVEALNEKL